MKKLWNDDMLREAVAQVTCMRDTIEFLGLKYSGSHYSRLKDRVAFLGLDISHWNISHPRSVIKIPIEDILAGKTTYAGTHDLKKRLLKEGLLEHKCYECGAIDWRGKKLALQLDHIDGNRLNNSLDNLRILCPNCHSQTTTYAGKNTKGIPRKGTSDYIRYKCSHCDRTTTNNTIVTCRSCIRKFRLKVNIKLTLEQIAEIQIKYAKGDTSHKKLGLEYGVSAGTIRRAISYSLI